MLIYCSLEEEVTGGTFNYTARWSPNSKQPSIVLVHKQLHLCDMLQKVHIDCPVKIGRHSIMYRNTVSTILPPVSYASLKLNFKLAQNLFPQGLFCFHVTWINQLGYTRNGV